MISTITFIKDTDFEFYLVNILSGNVYFKKVTGDFIYIIILKLAITPHQIKM